MKKVTKIEVEKAETLSEAELAQITIMIAEWMYGLISNPGKYAPKPQNNIINEKKGDFLG